MSHDQILAIFGGAFKDRRSGFASGVNGVLAYAFHTAEAVPGWMVAVPQERRIPYVEHPAVELLRKASAQPVPFTTAKWQITAPETVRLIQEVIDADSSGNAVPADNQPPETQEVLKMLPALNPSEQRTIHFQCIADGRPWSCTIEMGFSGYAVRLFPVDGPPLGKVERKSAEALTAWLNHITLTSKPHFNPPLPEPVPVAHPVSTPTPPLAPAPTTPVMSEPVVPPAVPTDDQQTIIAISTYGTHRVTDPATRKTVSAYKIGYSSAAAPLIQELFGSKAHDVSPPRASYRYIRLEQDVMMRHDYILLTLTPAELQRAEAMTRQHSHAAAYLWRDKTWWNLPDRLHEQDHPAARNGLNFDPTAYRPSSLSGERKAVMSGLKLEHEQKPDGTHYWWISGDTYPHREAIKRWNARWNRDRQAWYYIGDTLPDGLQKLMDDHPHQVTESPPNLPTELSERIEKALETDNKADEAAPSSVLLDMFGGRIISKATSANGSLTVMGENGTFARRTMMNDRHGKPQLVWVIDLPSNIPDGNTAPVVSPLQKAGAKCLIHNQQYHLEDAQHIAALDAVVERVPFARSPTAPAKSPQAFLDLFDGTIISKRQYDTDPCIMLTGKNITFAEKSVEHRRDGTRQTVWRIVPPPGPERDAVIDALKAHRAMWSAATRKWIFDRPDDVAALNALADSLPTDGTAAPATIESQTETPPVDTGPEPESPIRIIPPPTAPVEGTSDAVMAAVRAARFAPTSTTASLSALPHTGHSAIQQQYIGELNGSVAGSVFCYGYAVHNGVCIYLNMGGPKVAVEAIRAKLSKGQIVNCVADDAPTMELTAGEGNTGQYHAYASWVADARYMSMILVHDWAVTPNYNGKATTFIFRTSEEQATAKLRQQIKQLVKIPVFDAWGSYLYHAGQTAMLVQTCRSAGGIDLLAIDLDVDAWTRLLTGGLAQKVISLTAAEPVKAPLAIPRIRVPASALQVGDVLMGTPNRTVIDIVERQTVNTVVCTLDDGQSRVTVPVSTVNSLYTLVAGPTLEYVNANPACIERIPAGFDPVYRPAATRT